MHTAVTSARNTRRHRAHDRLTRVASGQSARAYTRALLVRHYNTFPRVHIHVCNTYTKANAHTRPRVVLMCVCGRKHRASTFPPRAPLPTRSIGSSFARVHSTREAHRNAYVCILRVYAYQRRAREFVTARRASRNRTAYKLRICCYPFFFLPLLNRIQIMMRYNNPHSRFASA